MEIKGGHDNKFNVLLYEYMGTAALLTAINMGSAMSGGVLTPIAIGFTVLSGIAYLGPVCGAHFNVAVTVAVYVREGPENFLKNFSLCIQIIIAELLGAITGCLFTYLMNQKDEVSKELYPGITLLCPNRAPWDSADMLCDGSGYLLQVLFVEAFVTFVFISTIMSLKYDSVTDKHMEGAYTVCLCLIGMIATSAFYTGGCLNPAVGSIQTIFQYFMI